MFLFILGLVLAVSVREKLQNSVDVTSFIVLEIKKNHLCSLFVVGEDE